MTIRQRICGVYSLGVGVSEDLVEFLKLRFADLQVPFETIVRRKAKRYSFLNYNFLFRRFFDLAGVPHLSRDFPPLKSRKKREDLILLYLKLLKMTLWVSVFFVSRRTSSEG